MFTLFFKKHDSSLTRQKVTKRKNPCRQKITTPQRTIYLTVSLLLTLIFFYHNKFYPQFLTKPLSSQALSKDWEIFLSSNTQYPPENAKLTAVLKSIETTTVTENTTNWSFLAEKIQKESLFSQVIVTNSIPNKLFVSLKERTPIMTVFVANKKHLLSQNGDVYKSNFPQKTSNLVLLEGVFLKENKNRTFRPNNSLSLSAPERERIKKAINIYHMTTNKNLNLEKITYEKYRGFSILLKNEQLKAVLGNDFLEKKTNRLSEIIKKTGKEAYNIKIVELDYEGKAFIQKKEQTNLEKNLDF